MSAWDRFVREQGPCVYTMAWRILGHAGEAEAVVQEVFREARVVPKSGNPPRSPGRLRRLAALRSLDRLRARQARRGSATCAVEQSTSLREAIAELPPREAAVFSLRYFGDLAEPQIAEACQITTRAVAGDLESARNRLEASLAATGWV